MPGPSFLAQPSRQRCLSLLALVVVALLLPASASAEVLDATYDVPAAAVQSNGDTRLVEGNSARATLNLVGTASPTVVAVHHDLAEPIVRFPATTFAYSYTGSGDANFAGEVVPLVVEIDGVLSVAPTVGHRDLTSEIEVSAEITSWDIDVRVFLDGSLVATTTSSVPFHSGSWFALSDLPGELRAFRFTAQEFSPPVDLGTVVVRGVPRDLGLASGDAAIAFGDFSVPSQSGVVPTACEVGTADADGDGVRDLDDQCPGSSAVEVDAAGCSLDQFCEAIDATTRANRRICRRSDWTNDEPLMKGRDRDCQWVRNGPGTDDDTCAAITP